MITRVRVKNFRGLADVDVTLGPLTVLVGRNAAGKSTFLDVLRFIRDAVRFGLEAATTNRGGITSILRWHPTDKPDIKITLTIEEEGFWGEYLIGVSSDQDGDYFINSEICRVGKNEETALTEYEYGSSRLNVDGTVVLNTQLEISERPKSLVMTAVGASSPNLKQIYRVLSSLNCYSIFPDALRAPQKKQTEHPLMESGQNLASVLQKITESEWYPRLRSTLRTAIREICEVRVQPAGSFLLTELEHNIGNGHNPWFDLGQESDGTIHLLATLVALYQQPPGSLLAIEEPELTLYPGIMAVLSETIKEATLWTQVLITTQSPDLISNFAAEELRVVEREKGETFIGLIAEHQREAINQQLFSGGDVLRIEGFHSKPVVLTGMEDA